MTTPVARYKEIGWSSIQLVLGAVESGEDADANVITGLMGDNPVEFTRPDLLSFVQAEDGPERTYASKGHSGTQMTVHLLPSSSSTRRLLSHFADHQNGIRRDYSGTYGRPGETDGGWYIELEGVRLMSIAPASTPAQSFDAVFEVTRAVPHMEADFPNF